MGLLFSNETLNSLFLYNGLFGVAFYFYMIKYIYVNFTKSVWVLIGGLDFNDLWLFSNYDCFGLTALLLDLYRWRNGRG